MKNRLIAFAALLALAAAPAAHAQTKVGVINMTAAIANTAEGKKAIADLQQKYQPRQAELERLSADIQKIQTQLSSNSPAMSEDQQRQLSRDLEEKQKNLKRFMDDAQTDFNADRDEAVRRIGQKMVRLIQQYAPQSGIGLVLDAVQVPIYFAAKDLDITQEIVKRYDAANPLGGRISFAVFAGQVQVGFNVTPWRRGFPL